MFLHAIPRSTMYLYQLKLPMENKLILISRSDWKTLYDGFKRKSQDIPIPVIGTVAKKYNAEYSSKPKPKCQVDSKVIQDFIADAKKVVDKEKMLPINLKRAMLLSDVFTEKRNQLKFQNALKILNKELSEKEKQQIVADIETYRLEQIKMKEQRNRDKVLLGKRLKNEISELSFKKRREKIDEIGKQYEEILQINALLENERENERIRLIKAKQTIDKMHREDIQAKLKASEDAKTLETKESEIFDAQLKFLQRTDDIRKTADKSKPRLMEYEPTEKEIIPRYCDLPLLKKSTLEEKRDLYSKILKQKRIQVHELEMEDFLKRKSCENTRKEIDLRRRFDNTKVTKIFDQLKRRRLLDRFNEYRNIWNKQCDEKRVMEAKCKQQDIEMRIKLEQKLRSEDEEYITRVKSIINEYEKRGKIITPIVKCLRNGIS